MPKFIKLTNSFDNSIFLNIEHIEQISKGITDHLTVIDLISNHIVVVKETPEQILELIETAH